MIDTRDAVFDRIQVDFLQRGGARVVWRLFRLFADPGPYTLQLQYSDTNVPWADNWIDCGPPAINASEIIDPVRRGAGERQVGSYRVILRTPEQAYVSKPVALTGTMMRHDWLLARETIRQHKLRLRLAAGVQGWLYRRRLSGTTPDPRNPFLAVTDPVDGSVIRSGDATTLGTPFVGGYFAPVPCSVELTPETHREMLEAAGGTADPAGVAISGVFVAVPEMQALDVFVADGSDRRYYLQRVRHIAEWRGVPLLSQVELRKAAPSDPAYLLGTPPPPPPAPSVAPALPASGDWLAAPGPLAAPGGMPHARVFRLFD